MMRKHFLTTATWAAALCGLLLSPIALGVLAFAAYFVVDGARALGRPASSAIVCTILGATLLLRWRRSQARQTGARLRPLE
jgi:hypothetical protein